MKPKNGALTSLLQTTKRTTIAAFGLVLALSMLSAPSALAQSHEGADTLHVASFTAEQNDLLNSDEPTNVYLDSSGEITHVEKASEFFSPMAVVKNNCASGRACWYGYRSPDAYYGFSNPGVNHGPWSNRGAFYTGNYRADHCWRTSAFVTNCSSVHPPKTTLHHAGMVTGVRVSLY